MHAKFKSSNRTGERSASTLLFPTNRDATSWIWLTVQKIHSSLGIGFRNKERLLVENDTNATTLCIGVFEGEAP